MGDNVERSFIMVKPDGVHRGVVGEIIKRFEQRGYRLVAMKFVWVRDVTGQITVLSYGFLRLKFNKILRYSRSGTNTFSSLLLLLPEYRSTSVC